MPKPLEFSVALVTEAGSFIGEATALALASAGADVAIAGAGDAAGDLAKRIEDCGGSALVIDTDISEETPAASIVEKTIARFGRLDVLVTNADMFASGVAVDADRSWQAECSSDFAMFHGNIHRAALPHLLESAARDPRHVADIVSIVSVTRTGGGLFNGAKALGPFNESLRGAVGGANVRVSIVDPGTVMERFVSRYGADLPPEVQARLGEFHTLRAEDAAEAVMYIVTRPRIAAVAEIVIRPIEIEDGPNG